jgi:hypothetical protein
MPRSRFHLLKKLFSQAVGSLAGNEGDRIEPSESELCDVTNKFQILQKLYGRESEIAALLTAFEKVAGSGRV